MNQREKIQAQLQLLKEMKSDFSKNLIIPYVEDYAGLETERDSGVLAVSVYCNQKEFEERLDGNILTYFNDVESELEEKLEKAVEEEEADMCADLTSVHLGNPIVEIIQLVESIKK